MYRLLSILCALGGVISSRFFCTTFVSATTSLPAEYFPNYKIQGKRTEMIDILENIEASVRVGSDVPVATFKQLNNLFTLIFPYFPKNPSNNVVYKQCALTTKDLATEVTSYKYTLFKDRCFTPLGSIVREIETKYTVKAEATAKPSTGPAPLNVTLDARASIDPSDDTIPSDYFFRYYKDTNGVERAIRQRGPVINYTFPEAGTYIVHLTVRSSNRQTEGIFDGEKSIPVNVAPPAAKLVLYINGRKAIVERLNKVGLQDETTTVTLDPTGTQPMGGRKIISYQRTITSNNNYQFKKNGEGRPEVLDHVFPGKGIYKIMLDVTDNENNKSQATYELSLSDPVAIIKAKPEAGSTSTQFVFDASTSYSVGSRIKKYQRQILDPDGNTMDLLDAKDLKKQFTIPGTYTIKLLVTDIGGASSTDTYELQVGSTPPVPGFLVTPTSELKYPSRFILDASATRDDDVDHGGDALTYQRSFSNGDQLTIDQTEQDSQRMTVSFNEPGTYQATLTVTDRYAESRTIEKDIVVTSTLRPEMVITPLVSPRGSEVSFFARTNKAVSYYEREFGDGQKQQTAEPTAAHTYAKAGIYKVSLRVANDKGEENILTRQVFVGQKDLPLAARRVKSAVGGLELTPSMNCVLPDGTNIPAYSVERYEQLIIDATESRNVQGGVENLRISFHPKNDEIYSKSVLNYKFSELGCQRVDLDVQDAEKGKFVKERVWFEVKNALPVMQNLSIQFPQSKNQQELTPGLPKLSLGDSEIGLDTSFSSIVVRAQVQGARDPDGALAYYRRWYYPNTDDTRKEGFKITPVGVPGATFVIPKPGSPTEYSFVVELVDNDGGKITSEQLLGKGPIVFFPPGEVELDQPIVGLSVDTVNAKVGDSLTFNVTASLPSDRPDFEATRVIKYDFDGDGLYDQTTKKTSVAYAYQKPGTYTPKAAVYYRDRAGIALAEKITVVKAVTPRLLYATYGKTVLVRDMTIGDVEEKKICMDMTKCAGSGDQEFFTGESFLYTYPDYGVYTPRLVAIDSYGNELVKEDRLTLVEQTGFAVLSVPETIQVASGSYEVSLGGGVKNTLSIYLADLKRCYLDLDITVDSNGDGDPTDDEEVRCNQFVTIPFTPTMKQQHGMLYHVVDDKVVQAPFTLNFLDIEETFVPEQYVSTAKQIDDFLAHLPASSEDIYVGYYKESLINLKASLADAAERNSLVIQLRDLVGTYPQVVPVEDKEKLAALLSTLSDEVVQSAYGGTVYDTAKNNILSRFKEPALSEARTLFQSFEKNQGNQIEMKNSLDAIITLAAAERDAGRLDEIDFNYIRTNLCDIIVYYELPSKTCGGDATAPDETPTPTPAPAKSSILRTILKIALYIVIGLVVIFGALIAIFALKAKRQQQANAVEQPQPPAA